ncbi:M1 family metallopeptidase [Geomicrobium sp. JSM 1781026]|uniref:M1 family metallopeptidase n=1 Tax=Geomicrobium sp. JSM 1781026 TaxID=3344580 RepID=UPI0035BF9FFC
MQKDYTRAVILLIKKILVLLSIPFLVSCLNQHNMSDFTPSGVEAGSNSYYNLNLSMDESDTFSADVEIEITNTSSNRWENLRLYFIPNVFTEPYYEGQGNAATIDIKGTYINGSPSEFQLQYDELSIPLTKPLHPSETINFKMAYDFLLPDEGYRFTRSGENHHLAQWYPMVPTYQNGQWNKEPFTDKGESYHTPFSNFDVTINVPERFSIVTSSDQDDFSKNRVSHRMDNIKEFFIAIMDSPRKVSTNVNGVTINLFGLDDTADLFLKETLEVAAESFEYFYSNIGPYPHQELDILLDGIAMEYPGVVTAGSIGGVSTQNISVDHLKNVIVHEIAHQWFYGVVSNDPFHEAWLDEGIAELATHLFFENKDDRNPLDKESLDEFSETPSNISLDDKRASSNYIYGKSSLSLYLLLAEMGDRELKEEFLSDYYHMYQYEEVNTSEFVRFTKRYFDLEDDRLFNDWLDL